MAKVISDIALADALSTKLAGVLGIDPGMVARIVIDLKPGEPVWVYVQHLASKRILELTWPPADSMVVKVVDAL